MKTDTLTGRRALVTGSVQGMGLGIATALAREGAAIVLHGLASLSDLERVKAGLLQAGAPKVDTLAHDLRRSEQVVQMIEAALAGGPVDILVNNAGIQHTAPLAEMPRKTWDDILALNLSAAFDTMRLLLPRMAQAGFGRVVNVASVHGLVASINKAPYVAAKFGLVGLSRVAALEYARVGSRQSGGVTINCVCPGFTETPLIEPQVDARGHALGVERDEALRDLLREKQPSLRTSLPEEIARVVVWLCEPAAHNLTGAAIPVDGGWTAQ